MASQTSLMSFKGVACYIAKYVTKQFGDWDLSDNIVAFRIQQSALLLIEQRGLT